MAERERLIELIYDAVEDSQRWRTFIEAFCAAMNCDNGYFFIMYPERDEWDVTSMVGMTEQDAREYKEKWQDPWIAGDIANQISVGEVITSQSICPDEVLEELDVYKEFLKQRNCHYGGGVVLTSSHHQRSLFTISRRKSRGPLNDEELAVWWALIPHLQRAVCLAGGVAQLRMENQSLIAYVDELPTPLFLLDGRGSIFHANDAADRFLRDNPALSREGSKLRWSEPGAQAQFLEAIGRITRIYRTQKPGSVNLRFQQKNGSPPLLVLIHPTGAGDVRVGEQAVAAVYVIDPGQTRPVNENNLRELFGLTPAEATLAGLLAQGFTPEEAACETGVTMNTIRTHLKRTLAKTGCRRQAELVALVLRVSG